MNSQHEWTGDDNDRAIPKLPRPRTSQDRHRATTPDQLRALLDAVRGALTLPYGVHEYDRRLLDRAALARTVLDGALDETPDDIPWNTSYLLRKLALEEQNAADRENNACRRCRRPFDPTDGRSDGHGRYASTPWCRSCITNCRDGHAEHVCVICEPTRYGQPEHPKDTQ